VVRDELAHPNAPQLPGVTENGSGSKGLNAV
jgi:hypothetical protein